MLVNSRLPLLLVTLLLTSAVAPAVAAGDASGHDSRSLDSEVTPSPVTPPEPVAKLGAASRSQNTSRTAGSASFVGKPYSVIRGGITEIRISLDSASTARVLIGSQSDGYVANLTVEDTDGGGVTIQLNTYNTRRGVEAISVKGDDKILEATIDNSVPGVLVSGRYTLSVSAGTEPMDLTDTDDFANLDIRPRHMGNLTVWTAPAGSEVGSLEDMQSTISSGTAVRDDDIATSDILLFRLNVTGLGGLLAIQDGRNYGSDGTAARFFDATRDDDGSAPLSMELLQSEDPPNGERLDLFPLLDPSNTNVSYSSTDGYLYVVVDTQKLDQKPTQYPYNGTFRIDASEAEQNYVYESDGVARANFELVPPTIRFTTGSVVSETGQEVGGKSTLAPGTEINLRLVSRTSVPKFVKRSQAVVRSDGTFTETFDFSAQSRSNSELPVEFRARAERADIVTTTTSLSLDKPATPTPTSTASPTPTSTASPTPTSTASPTPTDTPTPTETTPSESPTDESPTNKSATSSPGGSSPTATVDTKTPTAATARLGGELTAATEVKTASNGFVPGFTGSLGVVALLAAVLLLVRTRAD